MFHVRSGSLLSHFKGNAFYITILVNLLSINPFTSWPILLTNPWPFIFTGDLSRTAPMASWGRRRCWRCTPWSCQRGMPWSLLIRFLGFLIMMEMGALTSRWNIDYYHCQAQSKFCRSSCLQQIWLPVDLWGGLLRCMIRMLLLGLEK